MSTKLENFVKMNRTELDALHPSDKLWMNINAGMQNPAFITSKISWLKYFGYSTSVIVVAVGITAAVKFFNFSKTAPVTEQHVVQTETPVTEIPKPETKTQETPQPEQRSMIVFPAILKKEKNAPVLQGTPMITEPVIPSEPVFATTAPTLSALPNAPWTGVITTKNGEGNNFHADSTFSGVKTVELVTNTCDVGVRPSK